MSAIGHNSADPAGADLRSFVERVERLAEEKAALLTDIREVYAEAKAGGFDTRTLRQIVRLRALNPDERAERDDGEPEK
jgi:uncharacterized protein (UPF0335 family)